MFGLETNRVPFLLEMAWGVGERIRQFSRKGRAMLRSGIWCVSLIVASAVVAFAQPGAKDKRKGKENEMPQVSKVMPDLSSRPFKLNLKRSMQASAHALFEAWTTEKFDRWFAAPGTVIMKPQVDTAYFFEARHNGERHPHYGRFLKLEPDRLIQMTWLTAAGTRGVETVITVELIPRQDGGTELTLTHAGFADDDSRKGHEEAWPAGLEELDKQFK
jgi:uncharacterized protein YndB with AHSA1/START domain